MSRPTLAKWLREAAAALPEAPPEIAAEERDVLELDEVWSFIGSKKRTRLWVALCRHTRQIVSYWCGDRSAESSWRLRHWIPDDYRHCVSFSDFGEPYTLVFAKLAPLHFSIGKETGFTTHVERWNNTLHQR